ncbi:hypothetical protein JAAARDRAFT_61510 [Jaapia argillacea MUCL 33604]|uniref:Uncharacterized protein n=1 Tax=Jaapia argillacea MUCL 33604 TaxID=933084 RepID=A0A067PEA4_9AGAM|nr:hypothetical protein JAAARDRAFT_61510 [Jaapia argillacea MUCL 33604]
MLTSLSLTRSNQSRVKPRVAGSNNKCTLRFYGVSLRGGQSGWMSTFDVLPVNHSSASLGGRMFLSVGDSPQVYSHHLPRLQTRH